MSVRILQGDCREVLKTLPNASVHCCVTSPPYFGLRDYGHEAQIGLEATPDAYVVKMVEVFREVRRVLRDDGTLWLNLGSSYAGGGNGGGGSFAKDRPGWSVFGGSDPSLSLQQMRAPACGTDGTVLPDSTGADSACSGLCDGCLADFLSHRERIAGTDQQNEQCAPLPSQTGRDSELLDCAPAIPGASLLDALASTTLESWRQRRGVCSRCDARVSSLSMLPPSLLGARESVRSSWLNYTTRFKPKDMIPIPWMVAMALQADGWYLRQDIIWAKPNPMPESVTDRCTKAHEYLFLLSKSERYFWDAEAMKEDATGALPGNVNHKHTAEYEDSGDEKHRTKAGLVAYAERQRSKRDSFKRDDSKRAKAIPWQNVGTHRPDRDESEYDTARRNRRSVWTVPTQPYAGAHFAVFPAALIEPCIEAGCPEGGIVLDPFGGSGTTGLVADRLQRDAVLIELNQAYAELAHSRVTEDAPLFASVELE